MLLLLAACSSSVGHSSPEGGAGSREGAPTSPGPGWHLSWSDEFDGSALDPGTWTVEDRSTFGDGGKELACLMNRPQNVTLESGVLVLRAQRERTPLRCGAHDSRFPGGRDYSSAFISTKGAKDWMYGRFEIRAKLPTAPGTSQGLWPAFWLRPVTGGTGELDVLEAIGGGAGSPEPGQVHQTIWYDYDGTHPKESAAVTLPKGSPSDGFHVYAVEWEKGAMRWYVDGVKTFERTTQTTTWLDEAFAQPMFLRLNLAVGGTWPGSPDASTRFPADFLVDYVRVYERA
ncbi:glycosyl hydrolase family 16 [Motilibacter peucedani]|uniref:Glycosyl hydrolase family 16 n=1 Tax=Motilibacter peucedani TaxID=598650 RepID=A0A420XLP6_9ACTN|nr:glycosyl hydrolase family 16 [Motilibacter peucedani]